MLTNLYKTPWPYMGGKADAAEHVWSALGDCSHYVEPFAGSLAVLMRRPHQANRTYYSETVNDVDGLLVNAWRSIQLSPDATAAAASNPVAEADLHARHLALVLWREGRNLELLMGDPDWHDPKMGGWWIWGLSCWIGGGWGSGKGPWHADADGRLVKQGRAPRLDPGVNRRLPQVADDGRGANRPCTREPGVDRRLPQVANDGRGANRPCTREPGVDRKLPHLSDDGKGANRPGTSEPGVGGNPYHPVTMPELLRWFQFLSARLRHVRILNGDWRRCLTTGATKMRDVRMKSDAVCGVFLDPPYGHAANRAPDMYAHDSLTIAAETKSWCMKHGDDPDYRIVLAGYDGEHNEIEDRGWRCLEWFRAGFLKGGMAMLGKTGNHQQGRERLWLSPHCLGAGHDHRGQSSLDMFDDAAVAE